MGGTLSNDGSEPMPATVKSLEERTEDIADELGNLLRSNAVISTKLELLSNSVNSLQSQTAVSLNGQNAMHSQMAVQTVKLEQVTNKLMQIETRLEDVTRDHLMFKSTSSTTLALVKWVGVFSAGVAFTIIMSAFYVARSAGSLETDMKHQQNILGEIKKEIVELRKAKP
jgi:archaellum component FlaC